jgi:hypothetical protein
MVDKNKYNKMSQKKFEALMDRSERNILKRTEKLAQAKCASGFSGDPEIVGKPQISGASTLMAENKKAAKEGK